MEFLRFFLRADCLIIGRSSARGKKRRESLSRNADEREGRCLFPSLLLVTPHEVESSVCASLPLSSAAPGLNYFFPPSSSSSIFLANGKVHLGGGASPPPLLPPPFSLFTPRRRSGEACAMAFWRKKVVQERRGETEKKNFFALFAAAHARRRGTRGQAADSQRSSAASMRGWIEIFQGI